jgi:hypothetical protein
LATWRALAAAAVAPLPAEPACGLGLGSTLALLRLLKGLAARAEGVLPPAHDAALAEHGAAAGAAYLDARSRAAAAHAAALVALPMQLRAQWEALWAWTLGSSAAQRPAVLAAAGTPAGALAAALARARRPHPKGRRRRRGGGRGAHRRSGRGRRRGPGAPPLLRLPRLRRRPRL